MGYSNYWQDLNAKDFGIPQNRNRCFMISILGNYTYEFPKGFELKLRLKDMLEDDVDEKYFLSDDHIQRITKWKSYQNPLDKVAGQESIMSTITTRVAESDGGGVSASAKFVCEQLKDDTNIREVTNLYENGIKQYNRRTGSVVDTDAISSTLLARKQGDNNLLLIKNNEQQHVEEYQPFIETKTVLVKNQGKEITRETDVSNTLLARDYKGFGNQEMNAVMYIKNATKQGYLEATD